MNLSRRAIVIAGVSSGVGKTTITLATLRLLRKKGFKVQPFKIGPDFIDPTYHEVAAGAASRNLDPWLMGKNGLLDCFMANSLGSDISVIEGVMGLYDGISGKNDFASTAHVAKMLNAPVIVVIDASKFARSIAAVALGFLKFDTSVNIAGFIINNVASARHAIYVRDAMTSITRLPILGIVQRIKGKFQERHLGLVPIRELKKLQRRRVKAAVQIVSEQIDLDAVISISESWKPPTLQSVPASTPTQPTFKIAVAFDESFNFYYQDNLEILRRLGAKLEYFSPVNDIKIPDNSDGILLGGGFPEVLANKLEKNGDMIHSTRKNILSGMPVYAECGGLMYLTKSISDFGGTHRRMKMAGVIDADTRMKSSLTLGYTLADCKSGMFAGSAIKGHEFHYSALENVSRDSQFAYKMQRGVGAFQKQDGFVLPSGIAAYTHIHFAGNQKAAKKFVAVCRDYSRR